MATSSTVKENTRGWQDEQYANEHLGRLSKAWEDEEEAGPTVAAAGGTQRHQGSAPIAAIPRLGSTNQGAKPSGPPSYCVSTSDVINSQKSASLPNETQWPKPTRFLQADDNVVDQFITLSFHLFLML